VATKVRLVASGAHPCNKASDELKAAGRSPEVGLHTGAARSGSPARWCIWRLARLASRAVNRKETVRRFVDEAVNDGRDELIDELFTDEMAGWVREWFGAFRSSFPNMHMELLDLVAEDDQVVARFACSATHLGDWRGHPPTGRRFERVDEVYFFTFAGERIGAVWGIEDTLERFRQLGLDPADR
jgi:predicted ester cyclase